MPSKTPRDEAIKATTCDVLRPIARLRFSLDEQQNVEKLARVTGQDIWTIFQIGWNWNDALRQM